eukprot:gene288-1624_t
MGGPPSPSGSLMHDQVQWYKDTSMALELEVKKRVPGVAFFHIPLAEYHEAWACSNPDAESAKGGETGGAECRSGPIRDPGFGYHGYGTVGWPRRARSIVLHENGQITTYKTLDASGGFAQIDRETF